MLCGCIGCSCLVALSSFASCCAGIDCRRVQDDGGGHK